MKSNEEFIAGIYEKAAVYAENKEEKKKTVVLTLPVIRAAAMFAVCVGLLGVGGLVMNRGTSETLPNQGTEGDGVVQLANHSADETPGISVSQFRGIPEEETVFVIGTVESVDKEEGIVWLTLKQESGSLDENRLAGVKWDFTEEIAIELEAGVKLMAEGVTGTYQGAASERLGSTLVTLTEKEKLWLWDEETDTYRNCNNEERK